jgi:cobalt-zinc-cadmium efflux system membrane fusion protein
MTLVFNMRDRALIPSSSTEPPVMGARARRRALWLGLLVAGGAACQTSKAEIPEPAAVDREGDRLIVPEGSPVRERLKIGVARIEKISTRLVTPATVESDPARTAKITPPLPGRVVKLFVRFGASVKKGDPLLTIDAPDLVAAQTDYLKARSTLALAERTLGRQRDLQQHGIGAQKELEQAQTDEDVAKGELGRAEVRLKLLGSDPWQLGQPLIVRAPVDGRVVDSSVAPGEFHNDQNAVLMTVADLTTVWVTASVQEKDIRRVNAGDAATALFAAYPGESFPGHVLFVGDLLDPDTRTIKVRIAFANNDARLKPGMFATVTFTENAQAEVVVDTEALVLIGDKTYVFVETAPWTFAKRAIETGQTEGNVAIVTKGLEAGQRVVMKNAVLLQ